MQIQTRKASVHVRSVAESKAAEKAQDVNPAVLSMRDVGRAIATAKEQSQALRDAGAGTAANHDQRRFLSSPLAVARLNTEDPKVTQLLEAMEELDGLRAQLGPASKDLGEVDGESHLVSTMVLTSHIVPTVSIPAAIVGGVVTGFATAGASLLGCVALSALGYGVAKLSKALSRALSEPEAGKIVDAFRASLDELPEAQRAAGLIALSAAVDEHRLKLGDFATLEKDLRDELKDIPGGREQLRALTAARRLRDKNELPSAPFEGVELSMLRAIAWHDLLVDPELSPEGRLNNLSEHQLNFFFDISRDDTAVLSVYQAFTDALSSSGKRLDALETQALASIFSRVPKRAQKAIKQKLAELTPSFADDEAAATFARMIS